jgi:hypothetical protein
MESRHSGTQAGKPLSGAEVQEHRGQAWQPRLVAVCQAAITAALRLSSAQVGTLCT